MADRTNGSGLPASSTDNSARITSCLHQPVYRRVYILPPREQRRTSIMAVFCLVLVCTLTVTSAAWPTWVSGRRREGDRVIHFRLSGSRVCSRDHNVTQGVTGMCRSYTEEFGAMPSAVIFFWSGITFLLLCTGVGICTATLFVLNSNTFFLETANNAALASAFSAIPVFPFNSWAWDYCSVACDKQVAMYLYYSALVSMALAYRFTSYSSRKITVQAKNVHWAPEIKPSVSLSCDQSVRSAGSRTSPATSFSTFSPSRPSPSGLRSAAPQPRVYKTEPAFWQKPRDAESSEGSGGATKKVTFFSRPEL